MTARLRSVMRVILAVMDVSVLAQGEVLARP